MKFNELIGAYGTTSANADVEDCVNLYVEKMEGQDGKNTYRLFKRPGYTALPVPFQAGIVIVPPEGQSSKCPTVQPIKDAAYSFTFAVSGGTAPYTWELIGGAWPTGLDTFDAATGEISGTSTVSGTFPFTIRVTDSLGNTAILSCAFTILPSLGILYDCSTVLDTCGNAYSCTPSVTGPGVPPYTFVLLAGSLPTGLSLNAVTGEISGTPSAAGSFPVTIGVTDDDGRTGQVSLAFTVTVCASMGYPCVDDPLAVDEEFSCSPTLDPPEIPPGTVFIVTGGALPTGVVIDPDTGTISGTPTVPGSYPVTISTSGGEYDPVTLTIVIAAACVASVMTFDFIDAFGFDDAYIYLSDSEEPAILQRIAKQTSVVLDSFTLPMDECDQVLTDGTYIYCLGYNYGDDAQLAVRILASDFATNDVLTLPDKASVFGARINGANLYYLPYKNPSGLAYGQGGRDCMLRRLSLSDFSTVTGCSMGDGQPTWNKQVRGLIVDASSIYVNASLSGFAPAKTIELFHVDKGSFAFDGVLAVNHGATGSAAANDTILQDDDFIYQQIVSNTSPASYIAKIAKSGFALDSIQDYPDTFTWSEGASDANYLYYAIQQVPGFIVRISIADLAVYDMETLLAGQNTPALMQMDGIQFYLAATGTTKFIHLCSYVPD